MFRLQEPKGFKFRIPASSKARCSQSPAGPLLEPTGFSQGLGFLGLGVSQLDTVGALKGDI